MSVEELGKPLSSIFAINGGKARFHERGLWLSATGPGEPAAALRGRPVHLLSGIGNPASFRALAERAGAQVRAVTALGDHHRYTRGDLEVALERTRVVGAEWLVTTTKDLVKLRPLLRPREEVRTLTVRVEVISGAEALKQALGSALRASARPADR